MEMNFPPDSPIKNLPNFRPWIGPLMAIILLFWALATGFYQVEPDEMGVVQQFGRYVRTTPPGLRMKCYTRG